MGYSESLDGYESLLGDIRNLREAIYQRYQMLQLQEMSIDRRKELMAKNQEDEYELANLKKITVFKPRVFDVYLSAVEIAIKKFVDENPEPKHYERCLHLQGTQLRKMYHANHTLHLINQCKICGGIAEHVKKTPEIDTSKVPFHDPEILEKWTRENSSYNRWRNNLNEIVQKARFAGGDMPPEFDYTQFVNTYVELHPEPIHSSVCAHPESQPRYRKYPASDCVALQCLTCGKYLRALKKSDFPHYENLPPFDEVKQPTIDGVYRTWAAGKHEAYETAREEFNDQIRLKYLIGEIEINDNSKFATYYNSNEWFRTRERILQRDNFECRNLSCDSSAECVHHIVYDRLGEEHDLDLISLCHFCHQNVHLIQDSIPYTYKLNPSEIENLSATLSAISQMMKQYES